MCFLVVKKQKTRDLCCGVSYSSRFVSCCIVSYCKVLCVVHICLMFRCELVHVMLPFTFQNVSLSSDMNFSGVVLSRPALSSRLFTFTVGRDHTLTSVRVLVRAPIDGSDSQPIDAEDYSHCVVRALTPTLACYHRTCAVSKRLDVAAGHGYFLSVSTSGRTVAFM